MAKDAENTGNCKKENYHLQSYHPGDKNGLLIFWSFSSQTVFNVSTHINKFMFSKREIIPTFIKCPTRTRYYSRHFEYMSSDSYNNPAKKKKTVLNIKANLDHEEERYWHLSALTGYQACSAARRPPHTQPREVGTFLFFNQARGLVQGHEEGSGRATMQTQVCLTQNACSQSPPTSTMPPKARPQQTAPTDPAFPIWSTFSPTHISYPSWACRHHSFPVL